jgi:tetratricopeptide (TPR) repeat protein
VAFVTLAVAIAAAGLGVSALNSRLDTKNMLVASAELTQLKLEQANARANADITNLNAQKAETQAVVRQLVAVTNPALTSQTALLDTKASPRGNRERARSLWQQGYRAFTQGKEDEARRFYARAAKADSHYAPAFNSLGRMAINDHDYDEAKAQLDAAIKADPKYAPAYQNLAVLYALQNRYSDASEVLTKLPDANAAAR